jgi:hypothetical protein
MPLYSRQIPHELIWDGIQADAMASWPLAA